MKKIFTHLFALFLFSFLTTSAWAQTTVTLTPSSGSYTATNDAGTWASKWTSTTEPTTTLSVSSNNMSTNPGDGAFEIAPGTAGSSVWSFAVKGYKINSYTFTYKLKETIDGTIKITADGGEHDVTSEEQILTAYSNSFTLSGTNSCIVITGISLQVEELTVSRTLEVGHVYMFESARDTRSLRAVDEKDVHTKATDAEDKAQQWYVTKEGDYYVLRNLAYGKYLMGAASRNTAWALTDDYSNQYNKFELHVSNTTLNTLKTYGSDEYGYMHDDTNADNGGCNVVGWLNGDTNTGSHWTIYDMGYSAEEITELLEAVPTTAELNAWYTNFPSLFNEGACYTPKYASLASAQATDEYKSLSTEFKALVDKIYNKALTTDGWAEENADANKDDWGAEYAKKFRVQMYEPYSIAGDITAWLGINAHANNDNPTGIYMPESGTLYVMVDGEIGEGATLRLINGGHNWRIGNATSGGYALKTGLNVIKFTEATGMLYICYNVDTYNPDGTTAATRFPENRKLSNYPPLKIHIEGGAINGFYNACGDFRTDAEDMWKTVTGESVDCDADWTYMETRANLSVLPVLGHRQILLFQLEDTGGNSGMKTLLPESISVPDVPHSRTESWDDFNMSLNTTTHKINIMMEAWDRIIYSEHATMGLLSNEDMAKMNDLFPRWKSDKSYAEIYDYTGASDIDSKTYREFCQGVDYSEYFNHHGVALGTETGYMYGGWDHCGYHINTFGSIVSKLASEAGPTWGPAHEIGHQHQGIFNLNGQTEVTNNFFSNVAVWYMGMGTSRYNGNNGSLESVLDAYNTENNDAYTNNIWALTHIYYRLWLYYHLAGNNTQFWPRLFELLRNERLQNGGQISGDRSLLLFYKHACDAAGEDLTEFFRAHGYLEVMDNRLVGDYSNATYNQTQEMVDEAIAYVKDKWSKQNYSILFINDGTSNTTLQHNGTDSRSLWDGSATAELGSVTDFIAGNTDVTEDYSATVSDDGTVTMSGEGGVGFLILNDEGELVSFSNKSTFEISDEAAYMLATGKATISAVNGENETEEVAVDLSATRFALLQELINNAEALTSKTSTTRVGYYKPAAVATLQDYIEDAQNIMNSGDITNLQAVYEMLYNEYNAVVANEFSRVTLVPGSKYAILSVSNDRVMTVSDSNVATAVSGSDYESTPNNQWIVERDGAYYIKNAGTSKYIQDVTDQNGVLYTVGDNKVNMNINEVALGCYTFATSEVPGKYVNMDGANNARVITWGDAYSVNSQWKLLLLEEDETNASKEKLLELAKKTLALVDVVATVDYSEGEKLTLTTTEGEPNYIWSNAAVSGNGVDKLLDSNINSYFHSQWNNSTAPTDGWGHHITVDLGADADLTSFKFKYTTRNESNLSNYPKTIEVYGSNDNTNYTMLQVVSGLKTGAGVDNEAVVMGDGNVYRYLRFLVTDAANSNSGTNTGSDGKVFFHMSEFSLCPVTVTAEVKSEYATEVTPDAVKNAYIDAEQAKAVYYNASATIANVEEKETALGDGTTTPGSYTTLLTQYNNVVSSVLAAKKTELDEWITKTKELMQPAGSVSITPPAENELTLQVDNSGGAYYLSTNSQESGDNRNIKNLIDGVTDNSDQYFHTDWQSSVGADHHLLLDMGEGKTLGTFTFKYTTRNNYAGIDAPTSMVVEGSNDNSSFTQIATLTGLPTGQHETYTSATLGNNLNKYRYIRFRVTGGAGKVGGYYYFAMSEFDVTEITEVGINYTNNGLVGNDLLLETYFAISKAEKIYNESESVEIVDAAIVDLQHAYSELYSALNNTDELRENLKKLIDNTQALYDKMATDEETVSEYYVTSALTVENLSEALSEIGDAQAVYDYNLSTNGEISTAITELTYKYNVLLGIDTLNVTVRTELESLITTMQGLLEETTENGAVETGNIALQKDDESAPFYIWSNAPAYDSDGVAGLIDENNDGSANTGTFLGTDWSKTVDAYTHYIEIDLGVGIVLDGLSFDYTTRNSGHSDQRPTAIKLLGSNDKNNYVEIKEFTDGMPVGQCEQWTMSEMHELAANYRYIRFAVASEKGFFHMSDFNLYSRCIATVREYYLTSDIFECLPAVLRGYCDAKEAMTVYLTEDDYETAKEALQEQIDALQAIVDGDVTVRSELEGLADATMSVLESVATISEEEKELTMQCTDANAPYYLYCNADGTTHTTYPNDAKGVEALLDTDTDNHLHTTYQGEEDDDLDHYLRLDMGENEAMMSFKFSYTGRVDGNGNAPKTMVIEGSNDLDTFDVIATLTDLPTTDTKVTYTTPSALGNGKAYRYIRFMVTETKNNDLHDGHPYFVLSQFSVTACKTIEVNAEYVSPNLPLSTLVSANNEVVDAKAVVDCVTYVTQNTYDTALAELQAAKNALEAGKNLKDMPVILTTDVNNPVLYKIQLKRNNNVFTYDGAKADASKKPVLAAEELGNRYQAWYFMQGTNSESYDDILIMPYYNEGAKNTTLRLSYANNNDGTVPAVVASGTNATDNWYITFTEGSTTEGWWNLQPEGGMDAGVNAFVNQYGGTNSTKLAFWRNASNPSDPGSQFRFVLDETDYSLSDAYYALYHQHAAYHAVEGGTAIGTYTQATADAFNNEYSEAKDLLDAKNATDEEYNTAREELVAAYEALTINMPDPAKYYVLRCNHEDRYIYVNADNKLQWAASSYDKAQSRAVWQFEVIDALAGTCKMKSLHTQSYMQTISSGTQVAFSTEGGAVVTIAPSSVAGAAIFEAGNNNIGLHAHGSENRVIGYGNGAGANHYFFEEVEDVTTIKHDVTMKTKFSSVTLGYNATVPAGVEAYTASGLEDGYTTLHQVAEADGVLPANTPVILYIPEFTAQTTVTFNYTESEAVVGDVVQEAIDSKTINGSLYTKYVECDDNADYYKLMIKNNEAKMYLMYKEFNAEGVSQGATHAGGHIKCSANKIYMRIQGANGMASFGMRFATPGTTGIDELKGENAEGKEIYDLTGRKLSEITEPGFYIVNGKKMYVK